MRHLTSVFLFPKKKLDLLKYSNDAMRVIGWYLAKTQAASWEAVWYESKTVDHLDLSLDSTLNSPLTLNKSFDP